MSMATSHTQCLSALFPCRNHPRKPRYWVRPRASFTDMIGIRMKVTALISNATRMTTEQSLVSAVGIDVAKSTLSVCLRYQDGTERALTIRNTETDISGKLLPSMRDCTAKTVMESTGHYHWLAALLLTEAGYDVRVVNPILAKQYTSANIRKVKTDPADASGLARMALVADNLPPAFSLNRNQLYLRKKFALMSSMSHHLQALHAALASVEEAGATLEQADSEAIRSVRESVADVKRSLRKLERECIRDAKQDEGVRESMDRLVSIPGVSEFCAALSLQWFHITEETTAKSWIAYAGLDISSRSSGTWKGTCRLTKRGNSFLRRRLYSAAWGAVMHEEDFKTYYDRLRKEEGRAHVEALTIIARKIVRTMFSVMKTEQSYDPTKFSHRYLEDSPIPA